MNSQDIILAVKDIISSIAPDEDLEHLALDVRLREQIELDSMDFLDIVMELRKRYGVQVPEEDYKELATLDGCVAYLGPKLQGKVLKAVYSVAFDVPMADAGKLTLRQLQAAVDLSTDDDPDQSEPAPASA